MSRAFQVARRATLAGPPAKRTAILGSEFIVFRR